MNTANMQTSLGDYQNSTLCVYVCVLLIVEFVSPIVLEYYHMIMCGS